MLRVAFYTRVSTEDAVEGYSLDGQRDSMRRYAEQHDWQVVEEYEDAGFSARTDNRPAFKRMIGDAKQGKFDAVLVLRGDRFARNRMHAAMYKQLLRDVGVKVVSVTEPVEEGMPSAVILEGMNEVIAEWYSVDLSVKITDAWRRRAQKGLWNGPAPFGYSVAKEHTLAIVPEETAAVTSCFEMYATGSHSYEYIATWLNQQGFHPRVERKKDDGRVWLWTKGTVMDMLRNHAYLGYVTYKGKPLEKKHEPIVTEDLFETVQQVRHKRNRAPRTYAAPFRTYLLKGLIRCVHCGEKLWAHRIMGKDYYQDTSAQRGIPCPIKKGYIRAEILEDQVSDTISSLKLPDSWRELVIEYLSAKEEIEAVEKERVKLEERLRRIKKQYRNLEIDEHEYKQELVLTQAQLASLAVPQGQQVVQLGDNVEGLVLAWETATKEERHQMLQMMLDAVYVDVAKKKVVGLQPKPLFLPLFNLEKPVRAGEMVLATDLTIGRGEWI